MTVLYENAGLFQGLTLWAITGLTAVVCYRKATR